MRRARVALSILAVCLLVFMGCSSTASTGSARRILKELSQDYAQIFHGEGYVVLNNVWNKGATSGPYTETVFLETYQGKPAFGWPWDQPRGLAREMPFHVGEKRIVADYDICLEATGTYNMAFELWPVSALPGTKDNITHEIMIWIANNGGVPAGELTGSVDVGGTAFDMYLKGCHGDASGGVPAGELTGSVDVGGTAFVAREPILKGPLDLSGFVDYLVDQGILTKDLHIASVELGNEIIEGKGIVHISDYRLTIQ